MSSKWTGITISIISLFIFFTSSNLNDILSPIFAYSLTQDDLEEIRDNLMEVRLSLQKGDLIEALQHLNNADEELLLLQTNILPSISNNTIINVR